LGPRPRLLCHKLCGVIGDDLCGHVQFIFLPSLVNELGFVPQGVANQMDYQPVVVKKYPHISSKRSNHDSRYWRQYKHPVFIKEYAPVTSIHFSPSKPHRYAVTAATRVQIYAPRTQKITKTISRFKDVARSGNIRSDGKLVIAGDDTGLVQVFSHSLYSGPRPDTGMTEVRTCVDIRYELSCHSSNIGFPQTTSARCQILDPGPRPGSLLFRRQYRQTVGCSLTTRNHDLHVAYRLCTIWPILNIFTPSAANRFVRWDRPVI